MHSFSENKIHSYQPIKSIGLSPILIDPCYAGHLATVSIKCCSESEDVKSCLHSQKIRYVHTIVASCLSKVVISPIPISPCWTPVSIKCCSESEDVKSCLHSQKITQPIESCGLSYTYFSMLYVQQFPLNFALSLKMLK